MEPTKRRGKMSMDLSSRRTSNWINLRRKISLLNRDEMGKMKAQQEEEKKISGDLTKSKLHTDDGHTIDITQFALAPMIKTISDLVIATSKMNLSKKGRSLSINEKVEIVPFSSWPREHHQYHHHHRQRHQKGHATLPSIKDAATRGKDDDNGSLISDNRMSSLRALAKSNVSSTYLNEDPHSSLRTVRLEPTYRLKPTTGFNRQKAEDIIYNELSELNNSTDKCYRNFFGSQAAIKAFLENLTTKIKSRIKSISSDRYKILVNCTLCEKKHQGIIVASKCLWDTENDVSITQQTSFQNYIVMVNMFAIYHE